MKKIGAKWVVCFLIVSIISVVSYEIAANDSATERTPGGLVFKKIDDVSIEKENLKISREKIEVSYVFINNSSSDIVTDVAFPIPNYEYVEMNVTGNPGFDDFTVIVDGKTIKYEIVARALLNGKDYTELLSKKGITVHDFNTTNTEWPPEQSSNKKGKHKNSFRGAQCASILKMVGQDKDKFVKLNLIADDGQPNWTVSKSYVWKQTFPRNSAVRIQHAYTPCYGFDQFYSNPGYMEKLPAFLKSACVDAKSTDTIVNSYTNKNRLIYDTVTYILKTANNWRKPIKEFKMRVEKKSDEFIGICFDGKVNPVSPLAYEVTMINYIPSSDLQVNWIRKLTDK